MPSSFCKSSQVTHILIASIFALHSQDLVYDIVFSPNHKMTLYNSRLFLHLQLDFPCVKNFIFYMEL